MDERSPVVSISKYLGPLNAAERQLLSLIRGDGCSRFSITVQRSPEHWLVSHCDRERGNLQSLGKGDDFASAWTAADGFT